MQNVSRMENRSIDWKRKTAKRIAPAALALSVGASAFFGTALPAQAAENPVRVSSLLPSGGIAGLLQSDTAVSLVSDQVVERVTYETLEMESAGDETAEAEAEEEEEEAYEGYDEYGEFAIAHVSDFVNVREGAGTDYEVVGRMYDGSVAHILGVAEEDDEWIQVVSGNVDGFIKAEFFLLGEDALEALEEHTLHYAEVTATRLNVRQEPDIESDRIGYVENGEVLDVIEDLGEWVKVQYTDEKEGYVYAEYVILTEEYVYAKTMDEIRAEEEAKREKEAREREASRASAEDYTVVYTAPAVGYSTNSELRQQIVDYALQFVGMRYVMGGQSLSGGTDCSGFTSYVYRDFGYSLSRTPSGQYSSNGRFVSLEEIQPGDIICYGYGGCSHVAMYIGNGQIVQEANSRLGCVVSGIDFMPIVGIKNVID